MILLLDIQLILYLSIRSTRVDFYCCLIIWTQKRLLLNSFLNCCTMDWKEIKKKLYYTDDDYIRDVIAFHLQDEAWDIISNYISQHTLFYVSKSITSSASVDIKPDGSITTICIENIPLIRWYLNNRNILEMDVDARFVTNENIHNIICDFFVDLSGLIDNEIYILDDMIKDESVILIEFKPHKPANVLTQTRYLRI